MRFDIKLNGADKLQRALAVLSDQQIEQAASEGINMAAGRVKNAMRNEMSSVFDRPTSFILQAVQVQKKAAPGDLSALIAPTYNNERGVDPQKILAAQKEGGRRRDKRSEVALRRAGILPAGYQTLIPRTPFPGSDDGRGNLRGPFIQQLLSYLSAYQVGGTGKRRNMTDRRRARIHADGGMRRKIAGPRFGRQFFVASGGERGFSRLSQKNITLRPGIWARVGDSVQPVLLFAKDADYKPRIDLDEIRRKAGIDELMPRWIRGRIYEAAKQAGLSARG